MSEELRSGDLCAGTKKWWLLPGSNQRPVDYDSIALPTELSSQPKGVKKNGSGSRKANNTPLLLFEGHFTFLALLIRPLEGRKPTDTGPKRGLLQSNFFNVSMYC